MPPFTLITESQWLLSINHVFYWVWISDRVFIMLVLLLQITPKLFFGTEVPVFHRAHQTSHSQIWPCTPHSGMYEWQYCVLLEKKAQKATSPQTGQKPTMRYSVHPGPQPSVTVQFVWGAFKHVPHNREGKVPDTGLWWALKVFSIIAIIRIFFWYYHVSVINTMNNISKCVVKV